MYTSVSKQKKIEPEKMVAKAHNGKYFEWTFLKSFWRDNIAFYIVLHSYNIDSYSIKHKWDLHKYLNGKKNHK